METRSVATAVVTLFVSDTNSEKHEVSTKYPDLISSSHGSRLRHVLLGAKCKVIFMDFLISVRLLSCLKFLKLEVVNLFQFQEVSEGGDPQGRLGDWRVRRDRGGGAEGEH